MGYYAEVLLEVYVAPGTPNEEAEMLYQKLCLSVDLPNILNKLSLPYAQEVVERPTKDQLGIIFTMHHESCKMYADFSKALDEFIDALGVLCDAGLPIAYEYLYIGEEPGDVQRQASDNALGKYYIQSYIATS